MLTFTTHRVSCIFFFHLQGVLHYGPCCLIPPCHLPAVKSHSINVSGTKKHAPLYLFKINFSIIENTDLGWYRYDILRIRQLFMSTCGLFNSSHFLFKLMVTVLTTGHSVDRLTDSISGCCQRADIGTAEWCCLFIEQLHLIPSSNVCFPFLRI